MTDQFTGHAPGINGPLPIGQHSIWAARIWETGTTATGLTGWE